MPIKKGTSRLAICLPRLGLVVKLPLIRPWSFLKFFKSSVLYFTKGYGCRFLKNTFWLDEDHDVMGNIRYTLLNGIFQNWQEYCLWRKTRSVFLEPTYFSLLGLVNVQQYGEELDVSAGTLWSQMLVYSEESVWSNGHHFSNPANFSYRDNSIRMVDYGGRGVREVVEKYGNVLSENFDPTKKPSWET